MSSELRVDTIKLANGNTATASGLGIGGVGKIGQVGQAITNNSYTGTNGSFAEVSSELRVTITPAASSSYFTCVFTTKARFTVSQQYTTYKLRYSTDGGSNWSNIANTENFTGFNNSGIQDHHVCLSCQGYFTPNTTNQIIISPWVKTNNNSWSFGTVAATGQTALIVMEVLA